MEENLTQDTVSEPVNDNLETISNEEGQVSEQTLETPSEKLILGKFKSVEDLTKAYEKLERHQGLQSKELGKLRQQTDMIDKIQDAWKRRDEIFNISDELHAVTEKYNSPEYFQNPAFRDIYKEAFLAMGKNLDADKLVNLLEGYVESRIYALEKNKSAINETEEIVNSMSFSKNNSNSFTPPKKRLDEMTSKEVDDLLEKLI